MEKLISVIIPVYNVEKYISECVNSVVNQTYKNLEIILVDDGSKDDSGRICDEICLKDRRIKVIHQKNGGLSAARNSGLAIAQGAYLFFLDSDDYLPLNSIESLYKLTLINQAQIAICNMIRTSKRREINIGNNKCATKEMNSRAALLEMLYGNAFSTSACGKLFEKELFTNVEFPVGKFSEDLFTIYKVILKAKAIVYTEYIGYYYYFRNEGSLVVTTYKEKHLEALEAVDNIKRDLNSKNNDIRAAISNQYINVIYDIVSRKPTVQEFNNKTIVNALKENRKIEVFNSKAPKRLRLFAMLSFLGTGFSIKMVALYNHFKWKNKFISESRKGRST
ncbi:MAG: glycosyltransferase family 2 protein [Anaerostipes sp.]|jgi:glycosyltransferase involved in cell wall biosynthesis